MPVSSPASTSIPGSSRGAMLPNQKRPSASATTAATEAASVAVKTPLKMPPRMMNGTASTGSAAEAGAPHGREAGEAALDQEVHPAHDHVDGGGLEEQQEDLGGQARQQQLRDRGRPGPETKP